jgi:hypothetical protein
MHRRQAMPVLRGLTGLSESGHDADYDHRLKLEKFRNYTSKIFKIINCQFNHEKI